MTVISQLASPFAIQEFLTTDVPDRRQFSHDIEVWHSSNTVSDADLVYFRSLLSRDELGRSARFRFEADRNNYTIARGGLRQLLGSYLGLSPAAIRFKYSPYGKPLLDIGLESNGLEFNISHSGEMILWAFTTGRRVGVDVEKVRRDFNTAEIAERFFSLAERAELNDLPPEQRHRAFFYCWTRKEAFIKALGEGLSHPLDGFDVSLTPGKLAQLRATRPDPQDAARWLLWDVPMRGDYAAALVAAAHARAT